MVFCCIKLKTPSPVISALIAPGRILTSKDITYSDWMLLADFGMQHRSLPSNHFLIYFFILMFCFELIPNPFIFLQSPLGSLRAHTSLF